MIIHDFIKTFFIGFFFLFLGNMLSAQKAFSGVKLQDLFKSPRNIKWVKHYKGRVNDMNDVSLSIGFDGKNCRGFITYLRSNTRFKLEGEINNGVLQLRETDEEESVTGYLEGNIKNDKTAIRVHWYNKEKTRAGYLEVKETAKETVLPTFCGENKWIRKYEGQVNGEPAQFILQRDSDNQLKGSFWYLNKTWNYELKGTIARNKFQVSLVNDLNQSRGVIKGKINAYHLNCKGEWIDERGISKRITFRLQKSLSVGCIEYIDYMASYDVTYPKTKNEGFNKLTLSHINQWKEECLSYARQLKKENPVPSADDRNVAYASGWYKIDYFTDTIVSGYLFLSKGWEEQALSIPLNYDMIREKSIALNDFFKKEIDYHSILRKMVMKKIQYKSIYGNKGFKDWIRKASFDYFAIREHGISYGTGFHPIYGRQIVTIPYSELEEYLDPKGKVSYLYQ